MKFLQKISPILLVTNVISITFVTVLSFLYLKNQVIVDVFNQDINSKFNVILDRHSHLNSEVPTLDRNNITSESVEKLGRDYIIVYDNLVSLNSYCRRVGIETHAKNSDAVLSLYHDIERYLNSPWNHEKNGMMLTDDLDKQNLTIVFGISCELYQILSEFKTTEIPLGSMYTLEKLDLLFTKITVDLETYLHEEYGPNISLSSKMSIFEQIGFE